MLKTYYQLTKPGIIRGNLLTTTAGFLLGSAGNVDWWQLLATLGGIALVIASACVLNNYTDRGIDAKMKRTKKRALVTGEIPVSAAMAYGTILGALGFAILGIYTNTLTVLLGFAAMFAYVVLYGIAKRTTVHGTLVGTISGSLPPVAGYTAATGKLDWAALLLFLIMVFWQMPHFYAIAIFRLKEYKAAKIPVWPARKGIASTKKQIVGYIPVFIAASLMLTFLGYLSYVYAAVMLLVGTVWLVKSLQNFNTPDDAVWARKVFGFSLLVLLVFSAAISIDSLIF